MEGLHFMTRKLFPLSQIDVKTASFTEIHPQSPIMTPYFRFNVYNQLCTRVLSMEALLSAFRERRSTDNSFKKEVEFYHL